MFLILLAVIFTYINVPVLTIREGPSEATKVETQAIYAEPVTVLEEQGNFTKIQTSDEASGWTKKDALLQTDKLYPSFPSIIVKRLAAHLYHVMDTEYGPIRTLPYESRLELLEEIGGPDGRWLRVRLLDGSIAFIQRGDIAFSWPRLSREQTVHHSLRFLDLPYRWGGRSSFGYDCSGFVQMLYRQMGYQLPRNSRDQINWEGFKEIALTELQPGDLVFFRKHEGRISHVGFYLGENRFIHSTVADNKPYIRISNLNEPTWNGTGMYTPCARALR